jgi:8-oxo-dGTP pyrophosphatase MutT (NUDIX family)
MRGVTLKAGAALPRAAGAKKTTRIQYAALPYRVNGGITEILLITSRRTHRWLIPKGWPKLGCPPRECAVHEAQEEAGVSGDIESAPIGQYRYTKYHKDGTSEPCKVDIFALKVLHEQATWPEQAERERRWCTVAAAAAAVVEPQLRLMILKFGARTANAGQGAPGRRR